MKHKHETQNKPEKVGTVWRYLLEYVCPSFQPRVIWHEAIMDIIISTSLFSMFLHWVWFALQGHHKKNFKSVLPSH